MVCCASVNGYLTLCISGVEKLRNFPFYCLICTKSDFLGPQSQSQTALSYPTSGISVERIKKYNLILLQYFYSSCRQAWRFNQATVIIVLSQASTVVLSFSVQLLPISPGKRDKIYNFL